jgi:DNA end-binding protein Ku
MPRATWNGHLRLSLVSCPVYLSPATTETKRIRLNQINAETGNRLKQQLIDSETGKVVDTSTTATSTC